jgi:Uma2 family endonuclease
VLVEVLSPTTERQDRTTKFSHYERIESLEEILLVHQSDPVVEHFQRKRGEAWRYAMIQGSDAEVYLSSIGCRLPLAQVFANVEFPPPAEPERLIMPIVSSPPSLPRP